MLPTSPHLAVAPFRNVSGVLMLSSPVALPSANEAPPSSDQFHVFTASGDGISFSSSWKKAAFAYSENHRCGDPEVS